MNQTVLRPARANGSGLGVGHSSPAISSSEYTAPVPTHQAKWLSSRYGLRADRARLLARLAFDEGDRQ